MARVYVSKLDAEGYNKVTGFNRAGWNREGIHRATGTHYNQYGYDMYGLRKDGFGRDGFDREGYDRNGYNKQGFNREGMHRNGTRYNYRGYDATGYNRAGFDCNGVDKLGFRKDGTHIETGTNLNPEGYNVYGLKNGYNREGELDKDIAIAQEFINQKSMTLTRFARCKGIDPKALENSFKLAIKKMPELELQISDTRQKGQKQIYATTVKTVARVRNVNEYKIFCDRHRLTLLDIKHMCGAKATEKMISFAYQLVDDDDSVTYLIESFAGTYFNLQNAITNAELLIKEMKCREVKQQLYEIQRFLKKFCRNEVPSKFSNDKGETWIEVTDGDIEEATVALKAERQFVCARTIMKYLRSKSQNQASA